MLAAAGIGAILSPPTLGAAAFIIAEYVGVPYLQVLLWATIPTVLYYVGILLAVEIDARRFGARAVDRLDRAGRPLLLRFGYHFLSLARDRRLPGAGHRAVPRGGLRDAGGRAVRPGRAGRLAAGPVGSRRRAGRCRRPARLRRRDVPGSRRRASARSCPSRPSARRPASSPRSSSRPGSARAWPTSLVAAARALVTNPTAVLILTAVFAAVAIAVLGLAVPVTASFIIAWVIIGPALQTLGRQPGRDRDVHLLLRGAVRGDAADGAGRGRRGGDHRRQHDRDHVAGLEVHAAGVPGPARLRAHRQRVAPAHAGRRLAVVWTTAVSVVAVAALAAVTGGWIVGPATRLQRVLCAPAAVLLLYLAAAHRRRRRWPSSPRPSSPTSSPGTGAGPPKPWRTS